MAETLVDHPTGTIKWSTAPRGFEVVCVKGILPFSGQRVSREATGQGLARVGPTHRVSTIALMTADANTGAWCCAAAFLLDRVR